MDQVHLNWCMDILKRINEIAVSKNIDDREKVEAIRWLAKQGLKAEREE